MANPQLSKILEAAPYYERSLPLPYELLMKIFHRLVDISDHPIRDLCSVARVCETWRILVLNSATLWSRIVFNELPLTDGNLHILEEIVDRKPIILFNIKEVSIRGKLLTKQNRSATFLAQLITAPQLQELHIEELESSSKNSTYSQISRAIGQCRSLKKLSIKGTLPLVGQQKWLADHLCDYGKHLEELHLTSSISTVSSTLFRAIASDYCPLLRVLDISTCDFLNTRSFDAVQLAQNVPNLEILRVANVSFKRVHMAPDVPGLKKLEELSMPIGVRDAERDDALLATLTYGSDRLTTLDLRGACITASALFGMPSENLRELHIDDIYPINRQLYQKFIIKWRHSLEVLSLVKINCPETIRSCLSALTYDTADDDNHRKEVKSILIREIDLEASDVEPSDLRRFLRKATALQRINLTACRSLPRGCKNRYARIPTAPESQLNDLTQRLGLNLTDSETEIDEDNQFYNNCSRYSFRPKKKLRTQNRKPYYVYS